MNKLGELRNEMKGIPDMLEPLTDMEIANEKIQLYEGYILLKTKNEKIALNGSISYIWLPSPKVEFQGVGNVNFAFIISADDVEIFVEEISLKAAASITKATTSDPNSTIFLKGYLKPCVVFGNLNTDVDSIRFELANLQDFFGERVKKGLGVYRNRLQLETETFQITIDKNIRFNDLVKNLTAEGGYILLYTGKLKSIKSKKINFIEAKEVLSCLTWFLYFINGRRCTPIFRKGVLGGTVIWTDYSPYLTDQYKAVITWSPRLNINGFSDLWKNFHTIWQDESDRDCLTSVLHWYVTANANAGFVEGSIVLIQNALELLYNWIIVEKLEQIKGRDAENVSAAFTQIRNAIVHSQKSKRDKLKKIDHITKFEVLTLGIWYVELILLYILDYKEKYYNRCSNAEWAGDGEEMVPWI